MRKILLTLFVGIFGFCGVGLINFGFAGQLNLVSKPYVDAGKTYAKFSPSSLDVYTGFNFIDDMLFYSCSHTGAGQYCYIRFSYKTNGSLKYCYLYYNQNGDGQLTHSNCNFDTDSQTIIFSDCDNYSNNIFHCFDYIGYNFDYSQLYSSSCPECQECQICPEVNTGEILSGYILESSIDTNYCVGNGYCPNECGSGTDFSGDLAFSNLYINNILHPGKENIFVDIPDYITWDYSTNTGSFNLYVGSGYDVDYINSIIDINSYRPDSNDFTNIFVSGLTLIFPYIVVLLFVVFVWKLLKRIFK